jgi:hypothetical protein
MPGLIPPDGMRTYVRMHSPVIRDEAQRMIAAGINDCEIARRLGVARTTVRDWRRPRYVPRANARSRATCPRCGGRAPRIVLGDSDYAELLGIYLGDGHITFMDRTQRLRIALDAAHPRIVEETAALLRRGFPDNRVGRVFADEGHTVVLHVYNSHLGCLFPQAGPGKKHDRRLEFEPWQRAKVSAAPWAFLRGCIRSDGCVFVNRTGRYRYLSYGFYNLSPEILALFVETCHSLGLRPCVYAKAVRLNRRDDVARLLEHVGRKG